MISKELIAAEYQKIQDEICTHIENTDGVGTFEEDTWNREGGGGGRTRILRNGAVLEKAGVNFSAVYGAVPEAMASGFGLNAKEFYATGVSIVMHPKSPWVPIIHMNIRYFELSSGQYWFGGGIDLTPHYVDPAQAGYFHRQVKQLCDKHHPSFYPDFKKRADDYFFLPHRNETRGIGGIFYDHLSEKEGLSKSSIFDFSCDLGRLFAPLYSYFINENREKSYTEAERQWQLLRRGRYVEFNLVYDRGTRFGLDSGGRTESILMSLPRDASWVYNYQPEAGSAEAKTLTLLKKDVDWINM